MAFPVSEDVPEDIPEDWVPPVLNFAGFKKLVLPPRWVEPKWKLVLDSREWRTRGGLSGKCYGNLVVLFRALLWFSDPVFETKHDVYEIAADVCKLEKNADELFHIAEFWCHNRLKGNVLRQSLEKAVYRQRLLHDLVAAWRTRRRRWGQHDESSPDPGTKAFKVLAREIEAFRKRHLGHHFNLYQDIKRRVWVGHEIEDREESPLPASPSQEDTEPERAQEHDDKMDQDAPELEAPSVNNDSGNDSGNDSSNNSGNASGGNNDEHSDGGPVCNIEGVSINEAANADDGHNESSNTNVNDGNNDHPIPPKPSTENMEKDRLERLQNLREEYSREIMQQLGESEEEPAAMRDLKRRLGENLHGLEAMTTFRTGYLLEMASAEDKQKAAQEEARKQKAAVDDALRTAETLRKKLRDKAPEHKAALDDALETADTLRKEVKAARSERWAHEREIQRVEHELFVVREERLAEERRDTYRDRFYNAKRKVKDARLELKTVRATLEEKEEEMESLKKQLESGPPSALNEPATSPTNTQSTGTQKDFEEPDAKIKELLEKVCSLENEKSVAAQTKELEVSKHEAVVKALREENAQLQHKLAEIQGEHGKESALEDGTMPSD
jgi:hypothetical protein